MPPEDRFWIWWPIAGIIVLNAAFLWLMSPLGLGFQTGSPGTRLQIADGIFRFSYFVLNPSMVISWLALPFFRQRGHAGFGWRLLGFTMLLLAGCAAAVFALI